VLIVSFQIATETVYAELGERRLGSFEEFEGIATTTRMATVAIAHGRHAASPAPESSADVGHMGSRVVANNRYGRGRAMYLIRQAMSL